jgi:DNA processing protein
VVEARERSGALITADFALEEGREVFAVPGEVTSALSGGTNGLLRHGAAPLLGAEDVLAALGLAPRAKAPPAVTGPARTVLEELRQRPFCADDIARRTGLPAEQVAATLVELELEGLALAGEGVYRAVV